MRGTLSGLWTSDAVHVERAERRPAFNDEVVAFHDEVASLIRVVTRFRWRLGLERLLVFEVRAVIASAMLAIGLSLATWLIGGVQSTLANRPWLLAGPLVLALVLAVARWPSARQAALAADRRLALDERLATALELTERRGGQVAGRFDRLQVHDAVARAADTPGGWLALDGQARREALLAAAVLLVAGGSLLLPGLPRPSMPSADQSALALDGAALDGADRAVPLVADDRTADLASTALQAAPQAAVNVNADPDLAARVQQEQSERTALDQLSQALGRVSAAQPAADAIRRGDFSAAQQQLSNLGDEADQLSDAAKQELSRDLQAAASASTGDRQLADRERQAAQALSRSTYAEQRQALHTLGDQVQRSGQRSVSADQLARDQGQLQQQTAGQPDGQGAGQAQSRAATGTGPAAGAASRSQASADSATGSPGAGQAPAAGQSPGAGGAQGDGAGGQPGGPGAGTGSDSQPLGDQQAGLDSAGQRVVVPTRLGSGPGVRPADGTEDQTGTNPANGGKSVSELSQSQQTGQVLPEQNLVPGEQRPVVRGYFR